MMACQLFYKLRQLQNFSFAIVSYPPGENRFTVSPYIPQNYGFFKAGCKTRPGIATGSIGITNWYEKHTEILLDLLQNL
jgi:hypothetical protein